TQLLLLLVVLVLVVAVTWAVVRSRGGKRPKEDPRPGASGHGGETA
ncbi:MAG: hypothetical protein GWN12_07670, partial [Thermoplasmata archaeon]|nr:hypothetical protein [Thermoplasmata archaeon]NIS19837.1 hypothetical protein [Thermoplasmata archaeon]NIT77036.1 hypothetical protein [Thermoplasmata archaeon]NIU48946.1 hypothetical protein [Thermoplasmata archaeon]NIW88657.1 hypothetical protein [Thermoplasmata archaeon]